MIKFVCKLCGRVFDNRERLYEHLRQYHRVTVIEDCIIGYKLEDWVERSLENILCADVRARNANYNYVELEVSVYGSNIPFFWKKVAEVMNKLVELGWYPEYMDGNYDSYLMEWHAVVCVSLDKVREVVGNDRVV